LIERRGERLTDGEDALSDAVKAATDDPELMCQEIIARLTNPEETEDDVAVFVVKAVAFDERLRVEVAANAEQLAAIRHLIRRWIASHGGTDDDCAAFAIAVTEACANAVEHAYGPEDATIKIEAILEADLATVNVHDRGAWREPRGENRGRGIPVMREFMDDVGIDGGDGGTTVSLRRQIGTERR
jgi:anti-sigma regulatory factor (Ser/Thr protein kinase)